MELKRRKKTTSQLAKEIKKVTESPVEKRKKISVKKVLSTGSTLLDLVISGNRRRGGGMPGGIIVEVFGPPGAGKTAILAELCASASSQGANGSVLFLDPEGRLDQDYSKIYGMSLPKENYKRPDLVSEMFKEIWKWEPENDKAINVIATDSLAALSTELEMGDKDAYGMKRAKEFSEGLRKTARIIANRGWLIACSNQIRGGPDGEVTPGGHGIPFYSSLRIRIQERQKIKIEKKVGSKDKIVKKIIGIESQCIIKKSTVDDPYRTCSVFIIFGYGIDDIRGNLQFYKDHTGDSKYYCEENKSYVSMAKSIDYIENYNLKDDLRERVIDLWEEIENKFKVDRKPKERR